MTLPVLFAINNGKPEDTRKVQRVLNDREFLSVDRSEILSLVERADALNRTRMMAQSYASRATHMLEEFPPSIYRDAIVSIPEFILNRDA